MWSDTIPDTFTQAYAASAALFTDDAGRLVAVKPTYKSTWDIPGGFIDKGGETPHQACVREVAEELGLTTNPRSLLAIDWAPSEREGDKVFFLFDGGNLTADQLASITLPADELESFALITPDQFPDRFVPRLANRVSHALDAKHHGHAAYLEHGQRLF
ncbi:NUDIX domain-containing protein [Allosaccharopolyspora coralli]|uniref:NUDIX domain-containing protein n=1 Tax=Allosaccharopolyspora coralli TaxID=2665642 RepID=A0A5Q3QFH8_9PSEU|nr:NUDIX hydrolase [Allosaccharopolyspora coralli]QGK70285.1 NUDIX domain-containing protein [Allosaccharopolyspora coralli]